ncbi:MAG: GGDEF domain-containing protein [Archangium sp.]
MEFDQFANALLEAAPDAVIVADASGRIVLVNAQTESLLGYGREELKGRSVETLVPDAQRESHARWREKYTGLPVRRKMGGHSLEVRARRRDGTEVPVEITLAPVTLDGARFTIAVLRDLSERRVLEERLLFLSTHDALTGLANRAAFDEALTRLDEHGPHPVGVLMVDLDGLKRVNDQHGHAAGDALIRRMAKVLRSTFRSTDLVARIGGDEFAVLAAGRDAMAVHQLVMRLELTAVLQNREFEDALAFSVGVAIASVGTSVASALQDADAQMYSMKRAHQRRL